MRNTDEQLREILRRSETIKEKRIIEKRLRASALASCVSLFFLIAVFAFLPRITETAQSSTAQWYGSLLLTAPYMGYVVVGTLAFLLGVCVTLLCIQWRKLKQKERDRQ